MRPQSHCASKCGSDPAAPNFPQYVFSFLRSRPFAAFKLIDLNPPTRKSLLVALGLLLVLVVQQIVQVSDGSLLGQSIQNALHVPWFAAVTVLVWILLPRRQVSLTAVVALALAIATECVQFFTSRDASLSDITLNCVGGITAITGIAIHDSGIKARRTLLSVILLVLVCVTVAGPIRIWAAYSDRDNAFPILFDPENVLQRPLIEFNSEFDFRESIKIWPQAGTSKTLWVKWSDNQYPGVHLNEVVSDWGAYRYLSYHVFVVGNSSMELTAAVSYVGSPGTSAFVTKTLEPGANLVRIPVDKLTQDQSGQTSGVRRLILHSSRSFSGKELLLGQVRLL